MAGLDLTKLSTYDLLLSEGRKDIFYVRLTDSLYKTLEDFHLNKGKGQIQLSVNKAGRGGIIQVEGEKSTSRYKFANSPISNKTGLDCLSQTQVTPGLTLVGTASSRLIIQAREDVYKSTKDKLILAEEKKNENQTVMIDFKNKRKASQKMPSRTIQEAPLFSKSAPPQRPMPSFSKTVSTVVNDSKAQRHLRERAIHILALRPHRKPELLSKLSKSGEGITKILAQISNTQNNMFHLKSFLYNEVQVDTWSEYSDSDRSSIRQQLKLMGIETTEDTKPRQVEEPPKPHKAHKPSTTNSGTVGGRGLSSSSEGSIAEETAPLVPEKKKPAASSSALSKYANRFVKQTLPEKQPEKQPDKQVPGKQQAGGRKTSDSCRKRSSSDDNKVTKKQCRDTINGLDYNKRSRKAAEELRLPFIESVKSAIAKIELDYVSIRSEEQKLAYSSEFKRDYEEYVKLKRKEEQVGLQFAKLKMSYDKADKKGPEIKSINRKTRDLFKQYINDNNWCKDKEKLMKLEAKLGHIKQLFKEYEESVT